MKRFRPYCAGYIVLYVLTLLSLVDTGHTLYCQIRGIQNALTNFYLFSYIITVMALCYVWLYARAQVAVGETEMRMAFPASVVPREGEARPMFLFRQGSTDLRFIDKTLRLDTVTAYGYVEDLGYQPIDASQAGPNNKLFPVHEVFPPWLCFASVNDALHRLPPLSFARTKNPLRICACFRRNLV